MVNLLLGPGLTLAASGLIILTDEKEELSSRVLRTGITFTKSVGVRFIDS